MFYTKPRFWVMAVVAAASLGLLQQFWQWEVERTEVGPGEYLVRIHRWGTDLGEDEIVAPDDSYKGVMLDVLPEGRYFLNPIFWKTEVHKLVQAPPGKCLVLTRKFGTPLSPERLADNDILATESADGKTGERGIVRAVKMPGAHRLNPYAYSWELVNAVEVADHQIGVRTLKVGKDPRTLPRGRDHGAYAVPQGYRGVQQETERPGTYYLNPYVETITPVDVRSHRVELRDIQFPSRDGFLLKPFVLVEYAVLPAMAPNVLVRLSDEGKLHQDDRTPQEQKNNEILQKVILPHIRGYARIEGSNFDARDFITQAGAGNARAVNNREKLQRALAEKVKPLCRKVGIDVRAVTLADLVPPAELAEQISLRELARVEQEKNKVRLGQYKAEQRLKGAEALKKRAQDLVQAETRLIQAKTQAQQTKEVAELQMKQDLENARLRLEAARKQAEAVLARGKADAAVIQLQNEAQVAGLKTAIQGFTSAQHYAQFQMMSKLAPSLSEIFASDESEFAKLFTTYMTPPANGTPKPAAVSKK
jgi:regulator of protease activity HflC (stomatin/prohibitin superfamily)